MLTGHILWRKSSLLKDRQRLIRLMPPTDCGLQGSKIALIPSYLRVPQAAGQVTILIFLVKINLFPIYANIFCDAGQVPIFRYFEAWSLLAFQEIGTSNTMWQYLYYIYTVLSGLG